LKKHRSTEFWEEISGGIVTITLKLGKKKVAEGKMGVVSTQWYQVTGNSVVFDRLTIS